MDATYTAASGRCSGVERVVRNLLRESQMQRPGAPADSPCIAQQIISQHGRFFPVLKSCRNNLEQLSAMQSNVLASASDSYRQFANQLCRVVPGKTINKWMLPQPGHLGIFKLFYRKREQELLAGIASKTKPVEPQKGDLFILPDAYWVHSLSETVWPAATYARSKGARVATIIYDLIPLTHPEFVGEKRSRCFEKYLLQAIQHSDQLVAISQTVAEQLRGYCAGQKTQPNITAFQLGAEIPDIEGGEVRSSVRAIFDKPTTPYLMVATFDRRKNHAYVLETFEKLWQAGSQAELCLVGRISSRRSEIVQRILQHPQRNKRLFVFDDLTDTELQHGYQAARAVLFPSIVEGYGLPIVESLWHGKRTFASDTPIHREVGGDACNYFDLKDTESLVSMIARWEDELEQCSDPQAKLNSFSSPQAITWQESWRQMLRACADESVLPYLQDVA